MLLDELVDDYCKKLEIVRMSTKCLYTHLSPWRKDEYHFVWDEEWGTCFPGYAWHINDIRTGELLRILQFDVERWAGDCPYNRPGITVSTTDGFDSWFGREEYTRSSNGYLNIGGPRSSTIIYCFEAAELLSGLHRVSKTLFFLLLF